MADNPRKTERFLAGAALLLLSPAIALSALAIRIASRGPIVYRATRVGRGGRTFTMYKLRTMQLGAERSGGLITASTDARVFPVGRVLRKTKLDESLQLVNVVLGDMALVGPRPEDPQIVDLYYTPAMMETLEVLPGLTSPGTLHYLLHGENLIPSEVAAAEGYYVEHLLPRKAALDLVYLRCHSRSYEVAVIFRTVLTIMGWGRVSGVADIGNVGEVSRVEAKIRWERQAGRSN